MITPGFVFLGVAVNLLAGLGYVRDTLRGNTQPNRVTWLVWGVVPLVAFAAQLGSHVGLSAVMTLAAGVEPLLILAASFASVHAAWRIGTFDVICGTLAAAGAAAWIATGDGTIAILGSITADALAALPTITKSWREPATESPSVFLAGVAMAIVTLLTLTHFDANNAAFTLYFLAVNVLVTVILVIRGRSVAQAPTKCATG